VNTLKKDKLVFNEDYNELLGVAVLAIERVEGNQIHFVLNFGGGKEIKFVGQSEWQKFLDFVRWFDWNPVDTDTWEMSQIEENDENLPFAEEVFDDVDTHCKCSKRKSSTTLKLEVDNLFND